MGQTVLARLMVSDMAPTCWLCGSVGRGLKKGTMASACLSAREKAVPSSYLDARHFSSSLYATGAFQVATLMLELRGSTSMYGFFKRNFLRLKFLPPTQSPLLFAARSCGDLSPWHWNLGLDGLVWAWDSLLLRYPSQIFIHHTWVWDQAHSTSAPFPPVWMDVVSLLL